MIENIFYTVARTIIAYVTLMIFARILGRKQISQMTFFNYVEGIMLGTAGASIGIGAGSNPVSAFTTVVVLALLALASGYIHLKSYKARKIIDSSPVTVVRNGTINEENMRRIRMTVDELMMKLREKNQFNLADVEFAVMETDGKLSAMPKSGKKPLTPSDMNIQTSGGELIKSVIIDGKVIDDTMRNENLNNEWLNEQLNTLGINNVSQVLYAGVDEAKKIYISKRN